MHFFNPAPVQKLVEVIGTVVTDPQVLDEVKAFAAQLGKTPVVVGDKAGFIANALLFGYLNHAASMYETRYATREDIDAAMRLGCGLPMGPLALLDLIGLDTAYEILDTMYRSPATGCTRPSPVLKQMVTAGLRGRKTGRGFYTYERAGLAGRRRRRAHARPPRDGALAGGAAGIARGSASSARARWPPASSRCSPRPATTRCTSPAATRRSPGCARRWSGRSTRRCCAASSTQTSATPRWPGCSGTVAARRPGRPRPRRRGGGRGALGQAGAVRDARRDPAGRCRARDDDVEPAGGRARHRDAAARRRRRPALLQPGPGDAAGRGGVDGQHVAADVGRRRSAVCERLGKHAVTCADRAGFIVNALLFPYLNDAVRMLEAHYATADDIDTAMKVGCGYPMGPFELLDVVGLDVSLAIQTTLYREFREPGFAPAPLLEHLVTAGYLGRKTGRGFRVHEQ